MIAGIGRTGLAMARHGDLPAWLAVVHPRFRVPHRVELTLAVVVGILVCTVDLRNALGFSSFGVLIYYAIANASAFTQAADRRRWPRWFNVVGVAGCMTLVVTLPVTSVLAGLVMLATGFAARTIALRRRRPDGADDD